MTSDSENTAEVTMEVAATARVPRKSLGHAYIAKIRAIAAAAGMATAG